MHGCVVRVHVWMCVCVCVRCVLFVRCARCTCALCIVHMHLGSSIYLHVCFTWLWQWSRASSKLMQSKRSIPLMSRSLPVIHLQLLLPQGSLKCMVQTSCQLSCGDLHGRGRMGGLAAHHLSLTYISQNGEHADNSIPLTHSLLLHAMPIILKSLHHQSQNVRALQCTAWSNMCN